MPTTPAAVPTAALYTVASGATLGVGNTVPAAPVAEFIGSPTSGTTPLTVTFTDQTTGTVSSWAWDFGDGGTSTSQNPSHAYLTAGFFTVALTATGLGGSNTRTRSSYVSATAPSPPPPPPPPPAPSDSVAMRARTSWAGSKPWTAGIKFGPGEIPSGQTIGNAGGTIQVDVRNRHADGSLRFAVLSGVTTSADVTMLRTGTPASGSNVAEPTVAATVAFSSVVDASAASVAGGSFTADIATARANGSGAWSRTTARKVREILGPVMSEFHYFVPTADAHTSVWFYVRAYSSGDVEVETVVENGWWLVASPGRRTYNVTVSIAGSTRYTGTGLVHYHHTRWSRVDWSGADPAAVVSQDTEHLQTVRGMPTVAVAALDAAAYTSGPMWGATKYSSQTKALAEQPTPFTLGNFDPNMGQGGYTDAANVWAPWDMAYLAEGDVRALYAVLHNTRASGYFSTHYRDETDGRPVRGSAYPTTNIAAVAEGIAYVSGNGATVTPSPTGGATATTWYHTHAPRIGDLAYMLTGRWTALEECQFISATCGLIPTTTWAYNGFRIPRGSLQMRELGWMWRDIAAAAVISPQYIKDAAVTGADASQTAEHVGSLDASIDYYHASLISNTDIATPSNANFRLWTNNVFGLWPVPADQDTSGADSGVNNLFSFSGFMTHYLAASVMQSAVAGASPTNSAKLLALAAFTARFPVGMLGAAPGSTLWDWRMSHFYSIHFGTGGVENYAVGPLASWDAVWTAITSSPYTWTTNPTAVPADNYLWRMGDNTGIAGGSALTMTKLTQLAGNGIPANAGSDADAMAASIAYAADLSLLTTVSGIDTAVGRYYGSDTWSASIYEGAFRSYPGFAYRPKDAALVSYTMPKRGQAVAFTTNTPVSVKPAAWNTTNWLTAWFGTFGGAAFVPTYSKAGAVAWALPGGHSDFGYLGQLVLNIQTGQWESGLATNAGVTDNLGTPYALSDTNGSPGYEVNGTTGMPAPGHPYGYLCFSPGGAKGKLIYPFRSAVTFSTVGSPVAYEVDLATRAWTRVTATPVGPTSRNGDECRSVWHPKLNRWWNVLADLTQPADNVGYLDRGTYTYSNSTPNYSSSPSGALIGTVGATMRHGDYLLRCSAGGLAIFDTTTPANGWQAVTVSGGALPGPKNDWARHTDGNWYAFDGDTDSTSLIKFVVDPVAKTATRSTVTLSTGTLQARAAGSDPSTNPHYRRLLSVPATGSIVWVPGGTKAAVHIRP